MSKIILAAALLASFGSVAATVHLGQVNAAYELRAGSGINHVRVGDDLTGVSAALGNTGTIDIDATSTVHVGQSNRVAYMGADIGTDWASVGGDLDVSAISIGNILDISIAECGECSSRGSHVGVRQTNMNWNNGASAYLSFASVGGNLSQTAAAIGNSATITITN